MLIYSFIFITLLLVLIIMEKWTIKAKPNMGVWMNFTKKEKHLIEWPFGQKWKNTIPKEHYSSIEIYRSRRKIFIVCIFSFCLIWIGLWIIKNL